MYFPLSLIHIFRERSDKTIEVSDDVYLDPVVREFVVGKEVLSLSPIEVKVMKLLCMNKNCILKKEVVVQAGWGNTYKESYRYQMCIRDSVLPEVEMDVVGVFIPPFS